MKQQFEISYERTNQTGLFVRNTVSKFPEVHISMTVSVNKILILHTCSTYVLLSALTVLQKTPVSLVQSH